MVLYTATYQCGSHRASERNHTNNVSHEDSIDYGHVLVVAVLTALKDDDDEDDLNDIYIGCYRP
jgi:hypothetical protein